MRASVPKFSSSILDMGHFLSAGRSLPDGYIAQRGNIRKKGGGYTRDMRPGSLAVCPPLLRTRINFLLPSCGFWFIGLHVRLQPLLRLEAELLVPSGLLLPVLRLVGSAG